MARFTDLPVEIQTDIWELVLPYRGGVHWVEFEGFPHPPGYIKNSLEITRKLYGDSDQEPTLIEDCDIKAKKRLYFQYCFENRHTIDGISRFFQYLYPIVPSVWGQSGRPAPLGEEDTLSQEFLDEIAKTRCCRQLSTYTQVTTLLSTCHISRLVALDYLRQVDSNGSFQLSRGVGPNSRPRPFSVWRQQYESNEAAPEGVKENPIIPTICGTLDLVVFRLHTASGYPTPILNYPFYQLVQNLNGDSDIPEFSRIGIEWHPLWATAEGRKKFSDEAVGNIIQLTGRRSQLTTKLYWLVDGIPRPKWDQYPSAIPAAFSRLIEKKKHRMLRWWQQMEEVQKDRLLEHHDLHQEFEANGRRYYVVFVVTTWRWGWDSSIEESFLDPAINWDGPFPGGEDLWPAALRDPVRLAYEVRDKMGTDQFCSFILSWEPI